MAREWQSCGGAFPRCTSHASEVNAKALTEYLLSFLIIKVYLGFDGEQIQYYVLGEKSGVQKHMRRVVPNAFF